MIGLVLALCFSFKYDGVPVSGGASLTVDDRLSVEVESRAYPESDAEERVLWFCNPSDRKSGILSEICDLDTLFPFSPERKTLLGNHSVPGDRCVTTMKGCVDGGRYYSDDRTSATEFMQERHYFHYWSPRAFRIASKGARSSQGECPFFEISQRGEGAVVALGWSGNWRADFTNATEGVKLKAGLCDARFFLEPGERVRTCRVLVMRFGKDEDPSNKFRRLIRRHFSHVATAPGSREGVHAAFFWGGLPSAEIARRICRMKEHGLVFEDYWVDAGWYGACKKCEDAFSGDWSQYTGDWQMNPRVHPDSMASVSAAIRSAGGRGLLLWFEPERIVQTAAFCRDHGDWVLGAGKNRLLDYGHREARQYVIDLVSDYARKLGLSCYRQDFNFDPERIFRERDAKDRVGITEIRHVMGLYEVMDEIRRRNPGLLIDNCASGARRLDLETLRRSVFCTRSDFQGGFNANADVIQTQNAGIQRYFPYSGCTTKLGDLYSLRSAYSASHAVGYWQTSFMKEESIDWAVAKKSHDEYRRIRRFFSRDFYNHGSAVLDPSAWAIWQYHDPETNEGVVLAFRRADSACDRAHIDLKGLPADSLLTMENLDSGELGECGGTLALELPARRSSTIVVYRIRQHD